MDYGILGFIWGFHCFGKLPISLVKSANLHGHVHVSDGQH